MIDVDPGPNWKGYNLNNEQDGIEFNIINGINFNDKIFAGVGLGYLNFEGINGLSIFSDIEYLSLNLRLTPLLNVKLGYSHLWNQYHGGHHGNGHHGNGTGTGLGELCLGFNFRLTERVGIFAKSGFTMTQQSFLVPIRVGIRL